MTGTPRTERQRRAGVGILYNWGPAKGLKWVCQRYGIENPLPELNGSQVAHMDRETLRQYAANDVLLVVELYKRMSGVYLPPVTAYQGARARGVGPVGRVR